MNSTGKTSSPGDLALLAVSVARRAGEWLMQRPSDFQRDEKSSALDFATQMDYQSERLIVEGILAARPGDGIFGEEGANRSGTTGYTWVIDPIDGTVNYVYDIPGWCVSVACKDDNGVVAGAVYAPALKRLWHAARAVGAFCNDQPVRCNEPVKLTQALVATGFAYDVERRKSQAVLAAELLPGIRDLRRIGSCALDLCMVASGMVDAYYETCVNEWDYAAATLIAQEAGAKVTVVKNIANTQKDFAMAAGPTLHASLAGKVAPHLGIEIR